MVKSDVGHLGYLNFRPLWRALGVTDHRGVRGAHLEDPPKVDLGPTSAAIRSFLFGDPSRPSPTYSQQTERRHVATARGKVKGAGDIGACLGARPKSSPRGAAEARNKPTNKERLPDPATSPPDRRGRPLVPSPGLDADLRWRGSA